MPSHEDLAVLAGAIREGELSSEQLATLARLVEALDLAVRATWEPFAVAFPASVSGPRLVYGWDELVTVHAALLPAST